jgi:hypothetical protein
LYPSERAAFTHLSTLSSVLTGLDGATKPSVSPGFRALGFSMLLLVLWHSQFFDLARSF